MNLQEVRVIDDTSDNVSHIIRLFRVRRNYLLDIQHSGRLFRLNHFRTLLIIPRDEANQTFHLIETFLLAQGIKMSVTCSLRMNTCATKVFHRDILTQHGLDNVRSRDKHLRDVLNHKHEVRQRRRINGTTGTRAHDGTDLRNDSRSHGIAKENLCISCQRTDAFLNARTTGIVESDNRCSHLHRHVHHFANLLGVCLRKSPSEYGEVLCKNIDQPFADHSVTSHYPVTGEFLFFHTEVGTSVGHQFIKFDKRPLFQK